MRRGTFGLMRSITVRADRSTNAAQVNARHLTREKASSAVLTVFRCLGVSDVYLLSRPWLCRMPGISFFLCDFSEELKSLMGTCCILMYILMYFEDLLFQFRNPDVQMKLSTMRTSLLMLGKSFAWICIPTMDTQRQGKMIIKSKSKSSKFRTRPFAVDVFDEPGCCVRTEDNLDQREQHGTQPPE